jgi:DNA-binding response OmpR family regulator
MKRILIIEDESLIGELLRKKLANEGYYVFLARDGEKGLEEIRSQKPDLVLLDIVLPRLNGFEVLEGMKKDGSLDTTPVIIISNSGQPTEIEEAKKMGVADWLVKTEFDPAEVAEKVRKQIGSGDETGE